MRNQLPLPPPSPQAGAASGGRGRGRRWPQHALRPGCVLCKMRQQTPGVLSAAEQAQLQPSSKRPLFTGQEPQGSPATPRPRAAPGGHRGGVHGRGQSSRNERPSVPSRPGPVALARQSAAMAVSALGPFSLKNMIEGNVFTDRKACSLGQTHRSVSRGGGGHTRSPRGLRRHGHPPGTPARGV